jgi:multidrug efflux pump subunit AcrB
MAIFAGLLILIILVLQFKSFRQTAIILTTIPLAAAGGIYGLYFTGYALSFTALFGLVSLMGIVVNNAILLMDSMNQKVKEGSSTQEAAEDGIRRRTRPILLTTVTTIMGLIPLMVSGSEMFAPMAIAIGSGLMFSTLITLLIIPILYGLVYRAERIG